MLLEKLAEEEEQEEVVLEHPWQLVLLRRWLEPGVVHSPGRSRTEPEDEDVQRPQAGLEGATMPTSRGGW